MASSSGDFGGIVMYRRSLKKFQEEFSDYWQPQLDDLQKTQAELNRLSKDFGNYVNDLKKQADNQALSDFEVLHKTHKDAQVSLTRRQGIKSDMLTTQRDQSIVDSSQASIQQLSDEVFAYLGLMQEHLEEINAKLKQMVAGSQSEIPEVFRSWRDSQGADPKSD